MSAVAKLLIDYGWQVSGSDDNFYPPVSEYIKKHKIKFTNGYKAGNIPGNVDLIIVGKHARLNEKENTETRAALKLGVPVRSYPEILGELSKNTQNIVVAGSYGKSTCAALLAWCLEHAGKDPSYFIGAIPNTPLESSKKGNGKLFVLEGDEYPSSNWDDKSKFLYYHPAHILLTSLTHDHLNIFRTQEEYKNTYKKLLLLLPQKGLIVACADGEGIKETIKGCGLDKNTVFYSVNSKAPWHIANTKLRQLSTFDIVYKNKVVTKIRTSLLGKHNFENILGVAALLLSLKIISPAEFSEAVAGFESLNRRLDRRSDKIAVPIYEGFGSSCAKAKSAIEAMRAHFPKRNLVVIFEPHAFSWRSGDAVEWYDSVFKGAEVVLIYKPPRGTNRFDLGNILKRIKISGPKAEGFSNVQRGLSLLENNIGSNSAVLILSSGGFGGFIGATTKWLEEKFPEIY
ncbi:MAG: hypothetical protein A3J47_02620 [Candidatus Yanofskybacteria bacterium RIFCSPHIGHO2_02_FULL_43_22]|uniref:UDP-N-acetylmuramate:L-alanyl-gamma-D-glutamyl-meso-diaminopimelate ligase n=1 Tax=Candidatus Yanofskybacteria bacterium RIFCSPHIGHO2_02_FULL_43_22 TaxID=1802681 RepID=A0A1F8FQ36_9BACT|nr:MAG: hypothetical protein A3J47_02620 [Candidatus Yanofskybacteria bacterium RIFCSPHIGHO2_02_FULL_43_22]